ncbi:uncharacterized protein LOC110041292 [Orbicella faveolata]|uniref:uncharacterized protein LOC110041292 n=1 Tax=Orbicella faveolata TaxID=48498 RepID=UPI0009E3FCE6|nr:uncharacterized protein LOC110041292 [Orbicella faveolata]
MNDDELSVYQNMTRNDSVGSIISNPKCFYLDPQNDFEPGGVLYIESMVTTVVNMICSLIATSGNAIIIFTFYKSDHLRSQSHLLLWCLAFADFTTGLIVQPFYGAYKIAHLAGHRATSCVLRIILETVAWFSAAMSCVLFATITGERYLALHYHLRYHEVVTTRKILIFIAYLVISTAILSLSRFAVNGVKPFLYINIFGLLSSLFTLFICYWKIYKQVRRHFCQIQAQSLLQYHLHLFHFFSVVPRSTYSGRQLLVGYWGQNGAGPANGPANYEKPLFEVCQTTKYDILAVSFVIVFFDSRNKGLPALNFAYHCETPVSPEYPFLLRCPEIEKGIKECQKRGKRVLMSIGGATGDGTLPDPDKAREFARTLFDLFLGGSGYQKIRPFGSAVMDGIDLDIEGGDYKYYPEFITELRTLMDNDQSKGYLITGAPQCPYPDHHMGPEKPGSGLEEAGQHVDHLYIQFYNNYCHTGAGNWFTETLDKWLAFSKRMKPHGPLIFIGMPAATKGASGAHFYRPPAELTTLYQVCGRYRMDIFITPKEK